MKLGVIKERKIPQDRRSPLSPAHCQEITDNYADLQLFVEKSNIRCFPDDEYLKRGLPLVNAMHHCDVLMGVKEVPVQQLIPGKTYFFFSHTIKEQPYNQKMLKAILKKNIRLIDYEVLTDENGNRLIAFGRFAGMVGAHNAMWTYGQRSNKFTLPRMHSCTDYEEAKVFYQNVQWPAIKIVLTGTGRVGQGAVEVLRDMEITQVSPEDFLQNSFDKAVFTQLDCYDYAERKDGEEFVDQHFYNHPEQYKSSFLPYAQTADIFINGIYWDPAAPQFFTKEEMKSPDFNLSVIADITCDIAPESSIPSTLRASTIEEPVYGYEPEKESECAAFSEDGIDMMAIDNLPNELPRDSSKAFGDKLVKYIIPELTDIENSDILDRATIAKNGQLGTHFQYLQSYAGIK